MIFWILLGSIPVVLLVAAIWTRATSSQYWRHVDWDAAWTAAGVPIFLLVLLSFFGTFVAAMGVYGSPPQYTETNHLGLRALTNGTEATGSFFLGSGIINDQQQFSFIKIKDGYSTVGTVVANDNARVFEDEPNSPYLDIVSGYRDVTWLLPWLVRIPAGTDIYNFHVPTDSVVEGYNIDISQDNN